jgi:thiol:disulfide interchange protein DsbC
MLTGLLAACAAQPPATRLSTDETLQKLRAQFPGVAVDSVQMSADMPGWYEVMTRDELVYADVEGRHLFVGKVVDIGTQADLTAKRWNELNRIEFSSLPLDQAIATVRGDGSRKLAVFADPFCPYCEQLEKDLQGITDVTVYTFLYPLERVHPGATEAARDIWCAPDRANSWTQWMLNHKAPTRQECSDTPLAVLGALGDKLRINSTPTLIFQDGTRFAGAIPAQQMEQLLAKPQR